MLQKLKCLGYGLVMFLLGGVLSPSVFALESPQRYFDWNYTSSDPKILGLDTTSDYHSFDQFDYVLGFTASWAPDNPLYFIKRLEETAIMAFTFNPIKKEENRLEIAGERLQEMQDMATKGKSRVVQSLAKSYQNTTDDLSENLEKLKDSGQDVAGLAAAEDIEAAKHLLVLEEIALQVPPAAEDGIKTALAASENVVDTVADVSGRPAIPQDLIARLQSLKALGILTAEEVTKLVSATTRGEARGLMRQYADNNIIPSSDFRKFDETAKFFFPAGYNTVIEIRKFAELKRLETEKPDDSTLQKVQEFADKYQPGDVIPSDIRRWFIPLVRLEELQNTIRPDLIDKDWLKYRPEDQQKYEEIVQRITPRPEDVTYVNRLISNNPNLAQDPSYLRLKALGDKFGASCPSPLAWVFNSSLPSGGFCSSNANSILPSVPNRGAACGQAITSAQSPDGNNCVAYSTTCVPDGWSIVSSCNLERRGPGDNSYQSCNRGAHWVSIPYMPNGGYCVPNYSYPIAGDTQSGQPCPPSYHRNEPGGVCYPDNPTGGTLISTLPASGTCGSSYRWVAEPTSPTRGYCSPDYPNYGDGFPSPIAPPTYCPTGTMFRDGKCETYNPPPANGCPTNSWWNGQKCIESKDCGSGKYQDSNGQCKSSADEYSRYTSQCAGRPIPTEGCGAGYWDMASCSCRYTPSPDNKTCPAGYRAVPLPQSGFECVKDSAPQPPGSCTKPADCGSLNTYWDSASCVCRSTLDPLPNYSPNLTRESCGPGYYWDGRGCISTSPGNYPTSSCPPPAAGCGSNSWWDSGSCSCKSSSSPPTSPGANSCGQGYYWNGSYCTPSSGGSSPAPSSQPAYSPPPSYTPPVSNPAPAPSSEPQPQSQPSTAPAPVSVSPPQESVPPPPPPPPSP